MTARPDAIDTEARELLYDLVSTPSESGSERAASERLVEFFEARGRDAWLDETDSVRAPADDACLLTSHVDTVPGEIPVGVESGELRGRGSVDATGPLAAMAVAAVETGLSFVGVTGEETDSRGARHLVATRDAPDAVVNGEPSGWDAVTLGYRGLTKAQFGAETDAAHTSRPEPNAVQHAVAWWSQVETEFSTPDDAPVFDSVTATPTRLAGGPTDDGLAVSATVDAEFRIPPDESVASIRDRVEAAGSDGLAATSVDWTEAIPPVLASPRTPVARAFRASIREAGGDPRLLKKTGTSDMNIYADAWDCPMATYGPGDSALDHAPDERLALAEFDRSIEVLRGVCRRLS